MNESDEITVPEAAKLIDVSDETIRQLVKRGDLIGRRKTPRKQSHIVIKRASVEAYLKRMEIHPES